MTKVSVTRIFDVAQLPADETTQKLRPLIDFVNELADNFGRLARNGIGVSDNLDAELRVVRLAHAVPKAVSLPKRPVACYLARQTPVDNPIQTFTWRINPQGDVEFTARTLNGSSTEIECVIEVRYS